MPVNDEDIALIHRWQDSPIAFIEDIWGLIPERDNQKFIKGKHLSWQQHDILLSIESALQGNKKRISVASAHGTGKTATISWLLLWYLFCHSEAQVGCTAPTSDQMYDVLWKEVAKWLAKMPKDIAVFYEWSTTHIRIREAPETWFARAKTARKDTPEAFAGLHGEYVMLVGDEASGIPDEIYRTAEGSLTDKNVFMILISNPTRLEGYFYDTHHSDKQNWQLLQFSSIESPLVDSEYNNRIKQKYGEDSDEYRIRVLGQFPKEDAMDEKGYVPLLVESDLRMTESKRFIGTTYLGIDPAGEGDDKTAWVGRDNFYADIMGSEIISTEKTIAQKSLTLMVHLNVREYNVTIDNFGVGANISREIALSEDMNYPKITAINVGEHASDSDRFLNKRAEAYFRLKQWLRSGGELSKDERWRELLTIKYKRNLAGKLQIMSKDDMRKAGIKSPNFADALMLTFTQKQKDPHQTVTQYRPNLRETRIEPQNVVQ